MALLKQEDIPQTCCQEKKKKNYDRYYIVNLQRVFLILFTQVVEKFNWSFYI